MDNTSTLIMSVKSDGIKDGADQLDNLTKSAAASDKAVSSMSATVAASNASMQKATATQQALTAAMVASGAAASKVNMATNLVTSSNAALTPTLSATANAMNSVTTASKAVTSAHGSQAAITREVLVAAHEIAMDSTKRLAGTMMVLANTTGLANDVINGFSAAAEGVGVTVGAAAAVFAAFAAVIAGISLVFIRGQADQKAFADSLLISGNFAGTTTQGLRDMAEAAVATGGSISTANEVVQKLAASGKFTAAEIASISTAAVGMERAFGVPIDTTIADFEKLSSISVTTTKASHDAIVKAVEEINDKYHIISVAQFAAIELAGKVGDTEKEVANIDKAMADGMAQRAAESEAHLGTLTRAWHSLSDAIGGAWNSMKLWGATPDPSSSGPVKAMQAQLVTAQNQLDRLGGNSAQGVTADYLKSQITGLTESIQLQNKFTDSVKATATAQGNSVRQTQESEHAIRQVLNDSETHNKQLKAANDLERENTSYAQAKAGIAAQQEKTPDDTNVATLSAKLDAAHKANLDFIAKENKVKQVGMDDSKGMRDLSIQQIKDYYAQIKAADDLDIADSLNTANKQHGNATAELAFRETVYQKELDDLQASYDKQKAVTDSFHSSKNSKVDQTQNRIKAEKDLATFQAAQAQVIAARNTDENTQADKEIKANDDILKSINAYIQAYDDSTTTQIKAAQVEFANNANKVEDIGKLKSVQDANRVDVLNGMDEELTQKIKLDQVNLAAGAADGTLSDNAIEQAKARLTAEQYLLQTRKDTITEIQKEIPLLQALEAAQANTKNIDQALASGKQFATEMTAAFGAVGTAIGGMSTAILQFAKDQDTAARQYAASSDQAKKDGTAQAALDQANFDAGIKGYANLTQAAEGMFQKNSEGYKIMADASKAFHAIDAALQLQSMATQITSLATQTAAFLKWIAQKITGTEEATATQLTANATADASNETSTGTAVIAGAAQMFAQSGWGGFIGVAAMAAVLAGLGYEMAGGSGSTTGSGDTGAANMQKTQGTGTVAGDSSAQSNSISASITLLANNSNAMLPLTSQMATSLLAIQNGINGVANIITGTGQGINANSFNIAVGTVASATGKLVQEVGNLTTLGQLSGPIASITSKITNALLGSTNTSVTDSGFQLSGTAGGLAQGQGINDYANVQTVQSAGILGGLIGGKNSTTNDLQVQAADPKVVQQFKNIFSSLTTTLGTAATALGGSSSDVEKAIAAIPVNVLISLQGLSGTALTTALSAVLSNQMDLIVTNLMGQNLLPDLSDFSQTGESTTTTLIRVASGIEQANVALGTLGVTAINFTDISAKQGDVATEIVRQSLEAAQTQNGIMSNIGQIISTAGGAMSDLITLYQNLLQIKQLASDAALNGGAINTATIQGAGGLSQLTSDLQTYSTKYFTTAQQLSAATSDMTAQFAALGDALPASRDDFSALVQAAQNAGKQQLVGQLLALAAGFDQLQTSMGYASTVLSNVDIDFTNLSNAINAQLALQKTAYAAQQTAATNYHNEVLQGITDQAVAETAINESTMQARTVLAMGYEIQVAQSLTAAQSAVTSTTDSINTLTSVLGELDSALSATSTTSQADARSQAMATLKQASTSTDISSISGLSAAITTIQTDSTNLYGSLAQYQESQATANNYLTTIKENGNLQLTSAQQNLAALQAVVSSIQAEQQSLTSVITNMSTNDANAVSAQTKTLTDAETTRYNAQTAAESAANDAINNSLNGILTAAQAQTNAIDGTTQAVISVQAALGTFASAVGGANNSAAISAAIAANPLPSLTSQNGPVSATDIADQNLIQMFSDSFTVPLPSLDVGTNMVPSDMIAMIHKGERVIPAADNSMLMSRLSNPATSDSSQGNSDVAGKIDDLIKIINDQGSAMLKVNSKIRDIAQRQDTNGLPPTRLSS